MAKTWGLICIILGLNILDITNAHPTEQFQSGNEGPSGQVMGVLVAVMVSVCVIFILVACVCCQRRSGFKVFRNSPISASVVNETSLTGEDPGHVNPIANAEFTIFTPLSPPHHNNNVFRAPPVVCFNENETISESNIPGVQQIEASDVSAWFAETEYNFPRSRLKYIRELGQGWFGRVVEGEAHGIIDAGPQWTPVAVRILEPSASALEQSHFLHEASVFRTGYHPNVLRLLGRSLEASPLLLIQEFCPKGDLKKFLVENRECRDSEVMIGLPLKYCCQLAAAVQFLHDNNLPHSDLAARTCQISSDLSLKLGDYGLAVSQYPMDYYQGTPPIPVRWSAPESVNHTNTTLQPKQVSCEANIWSLAVTFWEICEWGRVPYDWMSDDEVVSQVMDCPHTRLPQPSLNAYYIPPLYRLMEYCWLPIQNRPQINQIYSMLVHLSKTYTSTTSIQSDTNDFSMENFDLRWESFKPNTVIKTDNTKTKSASLTNLHGSFENLDTTTETIIQMDSWLENVASHTGDMQYVRGLSEAFHELDTALASEQTSSSSSFEPTPNSSLVPSRSDTGIHLEDSNNLGSLMFLPRRSESGSETEDETWRKRIERGAYSEKVKQKSKSVADLMVLTHIDMNTVKDIFQEELKKLQEERRESLLFVPVQSSDQIDCLEDAVVNINPEEGFSEKVEETNAKKVEDNLLKSSLLDRKEETSSLEPHLDVETFKDDSETVTSDFNSKIEDKFHKIDEKNQTMTKENINQEIICNFDTFLQQEPLKNSLEIIETNTISKKEEIVDNQNILSSKIIPQTHSEPTNVSQESSEKNNEVFKHIEPKISIKKEEFSLIQDFISNEIKEYCKGNEDSTKLTSQTEETEKEILKNIEEHTEKIPESNNEIVLSQIEEDRSQNINEEEKIESTLLDSEELKENDVKETNKVVIAKNSFSEEKVEELADNSLPVADILEENKIVDIFSDSVKELPLTDKSFQETINNLQQIKEESIKNEDLEVIDNLNNLQDSNGTSNKSEDVLLKESPRKSAENKKIESNNKREEDLLEEDKEGTTNIKENNPVSNIVVPQLSEVISCLQTNTHTENISKKDEKEEENDLFEDTGSTTQVNFEELTDNIQLDKEIPKQKTELNKKEDKELEKEYILFKELETKYVPKEEIKCNIEEKTELKNESKLFDTQTNKEETLKSKDKLLEDPITTNKAEHNEETIPPPPQFVEELKENKFINFEQEEQKDTNEVVTENLIDIGFDELVTQEEDQNKIKDETENSQQIEASIKINSNDFSLIQNFINHERNNNQQNLLTKPELEVSETEKEDLSSSVQPLPSNLTSDLLDSSNVQQINQVFNVFNVLVDHKPPLEYFTSPVKNYYSQPVNQNDLITDINNLLESECKKYESKNSVCTSSLPNDLLPLVNGINCTLSHKILNILTEEKKDKVENGEHIPKKLVDIALDSLKNNSFDFRNDLKNTIEEDSLKNHVVNLDNVEDTSGSSKILLTTNEIEEDSLKNHPSTFESIEDITESLNEFNNKNEDHTTSINGKGEDSDEDLLKISTDSLELESKSSLEEQPKKLSEIALENLRNNSNLQKNVLKEQITSFVEEEREEIQCEPKKLSDIVQDSLNQTYDGKIEVSNISYNLPDIILDNLQNKTFVKEQNVNEEILINITDDSQVKILENNSENAEDISDKNILNLTVESPRNISEIILDSLPCNSPVNSESTDNNISDKTVIEVKNSDNNESCDDEQSKQIEDNLENDFITTSTPFKPKLVQKKEINTEDFFSFVSEGDESSDYQTRVILGPCEEYGLGLYSGLKTTFGKFSDDDRPEEELLQFSSNFMPYNDPDTTRNSVDYSLETWDKFLGKSLQDQEKSPSSVFDHFSSKHDNLDVFNIKNKNEPEIKNEEMNTKNEETFTIEEENPEMKDIENVVQKESNQDESTQNSWEPGGGWFLHPQTVPEDLTGQIDISGSESIDNSYVGFTLDEECVNALRNELAAKLPHAQGLSHEEQQEPEDWDSEERNEIIVKYNVYATPLSPIPEESCCDDVYCDQIQHRDGSDSESEWSEPGLGQTSQLEEDILVVDTETHTALILESPSLREPQHRHTPSQDSCCSNDTLFNLEDLNYGHSPQHHILSTMQSSEQESDQILEIELDDTPKQSPIKISIENEKIESDSSDMNLTYTKPDINIDESENSNHQTVLQDLCQSETSNQEESSKKLNQLELKLDTNNFGVAPLPSPEDIPWRQLPASLLTYNEVVQHDKYDPQDSNDTTIENVVDAEDLNLGQENTNDDLSDSIRDCTLDVDLYSNLTDIRFSGPCDGQLMSTSFSESADYAEERDWDSGSDTRSSSSGEFIWKEGEHEESLRALHAASHDVAVTEDMNPMDAIEEENSNSSEDSDDCEEDIEETEFVPSAWDAQATPTKSALRSPEKSSKRKPQQKGVWFKKQKYHCVYEYPREPESPVAPPSDLWRPLSDLSTFADWELDPESCVPPSFENTTDDGYDVLDKFITRTNYPLNPGNARHRDIYQLNAFSDFGTGLSNADEDFFISSSARPFQSIGQSQFFPGQNPPKSKFLWQEYQSSSQQSSRDLSEGITPDSGIDDITPASISETTLVDILPSRNQKVPPLKCLAAIAANKTTPNEQKSVDSSLGGLRHTRNRLKLDLPPSPNSFTSTRTFSIEVSTANDPVINREIPTFTTFGKTRFSVQHVATPTEEMSESGQKVKNVSFEALPHKPMKLNTETVFILDRSENEEKHKPVEMVQGEASLLDSADEDSGIESSANATLERHQQQILD